MKIIVFAHRLELGGTQVNAIDLAAELRDRHGFDVLLFATPGPMLPTVQAKKLRYVAAPDAYLHPSFARMRALRELVRQEQPDLVHAWDWWQCIDAFYSVHLPMGVPMVVTDMMPSVTRILPKSLWTTFGVPELVEQARVGGRRKVELIMPPVDMAQNAPDAVDGAAFRRQHVVGDNEVLLVTVSRLAVSLKSESLVRSIQVVEDLGRDLPVKLVLVGDGVARPALERLAAQANAALGRQAVVFAGALLDPRPAYAAADIVIGMGGSSLRGLAFGKPVIVVGEKGFSAPLDPSTAESFLRRGLYGRGDGDPGNARLRQHVRALATDAVTRGELGRFAHRFAAEHFSLQVIGTQLADLYRRAAVDQPTLRSAAADALRTAAVYLRERRFLTASRDRRPTDRVESAVA